MMADAIYLATDKLYSQTEQKWIPKGGPQEPSLFISTELDAEECQTMALAFLTGINEDVILDGRLSSIEQEVVREAIKIFESIPLYIVYIPDFSIDNIERIVRKYYREKHVEFVFFDYIHTSMSFIGEISKATNGMRLREDQILFILSTKLKELANSLYIFIQSATQVSGEWEDKEEVNQNLLRGSKAIADRVDVGSIAMKVREIDRPIVEKIASENNGVEPNYFISFYKIRRGKYAGARLWCTIDLGTCRTKGIAVTNQYGQPLEFNSYMISVREQEKVLDKAMHSKTNIFD